jgi:hypothetical protein
MSSTSSSQTLSRRMPPRSPQLGRFLTPSESSNVALLDKQLSPRRPSTFHARQPGDATSGLGSGAAKTAGAELAQAIHARAMARPGRRTSR